MMVKCQECGNVYGSPPRWPGGVCGVAGCRGTLRNFAIPSFVKCSGCGNVFGSPPRQIGDLCTMPRCGGVMVAYRR